MAAHSSGAEASFNLVDGENLLWTGRPVRPPLGTIFLSAFLFSIFFVVLFYPLAMVVIGGDRSIIASFNLYINGERVTEATPNSELVFGLGFTTLVLLSLVIGAAFYVLVRMRERYAVTEKRVIIQSNIFGQRSFSWPYSEIAKIDFRGDDHVGTLTFVPKNETLFDKALVLYRIRMTQFMNIRNARSVEKLILERQLAR